MESKFSKLWAVINAALRFEAYIKTTHLYTPDVL